MSDDQTKADPAENSTAEPKKVVEFKLSSVAPMRQQLAAFQDLLIENEVVDVHGLGNAINMSSTCVEILRGHELLEIDNIQTFFPPGIRNSLGEPVPKMVIRVHRTPNFTQQLQLVEQHGYSMNEWEVEPEEEKTEEEVMKSKEGMNVKAKAYVPLSARKSALLNVETDLAPPTMAYPPFYHRGSHEAHRTSPKNSRSPKDAATRERETRRQAAEWWKRQMENLQRMARKRSIQALEYEIVLAPRTRIEDDAIREYLSVIAKEEGGTRQVTAGELLKLNEINSKGVAPALEEEIENLERIFGHAKRRKGKEPKFTIPASIDNKLMCIVIQNVMRGITEAREERDKAEARRERYLRNAARSGKPALVNLRMLIEMAREDGNPIIEDDDHEGDDGQHLKYNTTYWNPLINLITDEDIEPVTTKERSKRQLDPEQVARTVYIGQLPLYVDEGDLKQVFSKCGEIVSLTLPTFHPTRPPPQWHGKRIPPPPPPEEGKEELKPNKGFGYMEFSTKEGVEKALKLDSYPLLGRAIKVERRHAELLGSSASEFGKRFYLRNFSTPKYEKDCAWGSW